MPNPKGPPMAAVHLRIPQAWLPALDAVAREHGMDRTTEIRLAIESWLRDRGHLPVVVAMSGGRTMRERIGALLADGRVRDEREIMAETMAVRIEPVRRALDRLCDEGSVLGWPDTNGGAIHNDSRTLYQDARANHEQTGGASASPAE